jgi:hypothetical protein
MKAINAKRLLVGTVAVIAVSALASSMIVPKFFTHNHYNDNAVWVTIYDLGKTRHLDYGCVAKGGGVRTWTSGGYAFGSFYYIRGEVKENADCGGRTLCDTTVQVNPQNNDMMAGSEDVSKNSSLNWHIHPNGNNCYWDKNF